VVLEQARRSIENNETIQVHVKVTQGLHKSHMVILTKEGDNQSSDEI